MHALSLETKKRLCHDGLPLTIVKGTVGYGPLWSLMRRAQRHGLCFAFTFSLVATTVVLFLTACVAF
ncbi:unnamed protein product [Sphenostylis stenocarpa]|uniref:Uncharacterized protein n=1 Tax=Sphenostylis stenocarpa TaxID=92480 RepID=A0AA87B7S9_9FABA|nr:unnamed protein product [Sphenostylis stenocarpa]